MSSCALFVADLKTRVVKSSVLLIALSFTAPRSSYCLRSSILLFEYIRSLLARASRGLGFGSSSYTYFSLIMTVGFVRLSFSCYSRVISRTVVRSSRSSLP